MAISKALTLWPLPLVHWTQLRAGTWSTWGSKMSEEIKVPAFCPNHTGVGIKSRHQTCIRRQTNQGQAGMHEKSDLV